MENQEHDRQHTEEKAYIRRLLQVIDERYGYSFGDYAPASLRRRLSGALVKFGLPDFASLEKRLLQDETFFVEFLLFITVTVSEMFRDPPVFKALVEDVFPLLETHPSLKIWHAGCSTGQEVYSLAILLKEEGLLDRTIIYGTDINPVVLEKARAGVYPAAEMQTATLNYQKAGRLGDFSSYYTADYGSAVIDQSLRPHLVFAEHNLGTDEVFAEAQLILCRNVLIYFDKKLQNRALQLFRESLCFGGFLCLGNKESLQFTDVARNFDSVTAGAKIYRKVS